MKTTLILAGLVALVAAQTGAKGSPKGSPKGAGGAKGTGGAAKGSGFAGIQQAFSCITKCASDTLGIDTAALTPGSMPANLPCMDKMPKMGSATADFTPALTCLCSEPKIDATVKCQAACGSIASGLPTQKENLCKDPAAAAAKMSAMAAKFGGGASGAKETKGPGGATRRFRV